jgi:ATP-dependent Lhr-like helicase
MDSDDTLEAMAIARRAGEEELEPVNIPQKPYDALAHQIIGLLMKKKRWYFYEIYDLFRKAYPYADLTVEDIQKVLDYMYHRFPRLAWVSFEDMLAIKPRQTKAMYEYYFENLSMIPDEKQFLVVDENKDSAVGVLDEAFVAEYGRPGVKFIIRGSPWQILNVYGDQIYVKQIEDPTGAIPSWVGEEIPVPFEVAQEVGWIRGFVEEQIKNGREPAEVAADLAEKYPADKDAIMRALHETAEQVKKGYPVPTGKRILIEDWEDFVIIHAHFGSLTNRALAQLIGHVLSEQTGYSVMVQHDPYRIFVHTMGAANADRIVTLFGEMKQMDELDIRDMLTKATVKTGIFKRRMVHVARRFGAIKKYVDLGKVTLQRLLKSFEGTAIYEEALKETFTKDLDLEKTIHLLDKIQKGEIEITKLETMGVATPVARVGIERVSMKTDLIPPEKMKLILVESARARLLNEVRTFVCTNCWEYLEMIRMKDLPEKPACPRCGSSSLGVLGREEGEVQSLVDKRGEKLTKVEEKMKEWAVKTARLMAGHGKTAAVALSGRKLAVSDVEGILKEEKTLSDHFFELVIDAERDALKRRFW